VSSSRSGQCIPSSRTREPGEGDRDGPAVHKVRRQSIITYRVCLQLPIYRPGTRQQLTNVWMLRLPLVWLSTHVRQPFPLGSVVTQTPG
jgi:hypothetical protein